LAPRRHKAIGSTQSFVYALGSIEAKAELDKAEALDEVHDGDTIKVNPDGYLPIRCLAIDTPEVSFTIMDKGGFPKIESPDWQKYLTDPFGDEYPPFDPPLEDALREYIEPRIGPDCATNHARHAEAARVALVAEMTSDVDDLFAGDWHAYRFFVAFATEKLDSYGRMLGFVRPDQKEAPPGGRRDDYNLRLLAAGFAPPYFIWPNLDPFLRETLLDAVPKPGDAAPPTASETARDALNRARSGVAKAREEGKGVYAPADPLDLFAFELRFLARRSPPDRHVIDLRTSDEWLLRPQRYHEIENPEDRLFIPQPFVPLFELKGWKVERVAPPRKP
jgi:endonuclease YncB( thermonuclease family)